MRKNAIKNLFKPLPQHKRSILMGLDQNAYYGTDFTYSNTNLNSFVNTYNPTLCFALINLTDKSSQTNLNDNTKIIRVRRTSDNLEADIYGDALKRLSNSSPAVYTQNSQTQTTTFQNFFAGTQCAVVKWYNQAINTDGTRNTNDLYNLTAAAQPKISNPGQNGEIAFHDSSNIPHIYGAAGTGYLNFTTIINTKNNPYGDLSIFLVKSGTLNIAANVFAADEMGAPTNTVQKFLSSSMTFNKEVYYNNEQVSSIDQDIIADSFRSPFRGAVTGMDGGNSKSAILEMHEENNESSLTKKRAHFYGNNKYSFLDVGGTGLLTITNTTGFRALPGGKILETGVRTDVGLSAAFCLENDIFVIAGNSAYTFINDAQVSTSIQDSSAILTNKTGASIRLITTTAPTGNPTIGGVTYNYVSLSVAGQTYYITTTNFTGSTYPNGTTITAVTTDAAWASATTGVRRSYSDIFGTYYNGLAAETINSQGGYTAAGTSWKVLTATQAISLGVSQSGGYTIGSKQNKSIRVFMYQLSDAEYAAAGNTGRWTRATSFNFGYRIFGLWQWGTYMNNTYRAGASALIYFDRSVHSIRSEIHADLNRLLKIHS